MCLTWLLYTKSINKCHQLATVRQHCLQHPTVAPFDNTWWSEILVKIWQFFIPHLRLTPPLEGSLSVSEYCHNVWDVQLEWRGYQTAKKIWGYDYSFWQNTQMWQTDRQTDTAWHHAAKPLCYIPLLLSITSGCKLEKLLDWTGSRTMLPVTLTIDLLTPTADRFMHWPTDVHS